MSARGLGTLAVLWLAASASYLALTDFPFTPDSYAYVGAAESLRDRGDLTVPFAPSGAAALPVPYSAWPPGYPLAIAAAGALGFDAWAAARVWALAGVAIAVVLLALLARSLPEHNSMFVLIVASWPLAQFAARAWSEGPFAACACGCLYALYRWRTAPDARLRYLAVALAFAAVATMWRYSGVFLLFPIAYFAWRSPWSMQRIAGVVGCLLAATPLGLWLLRNAGLTIGWRGAAVHVPAWWRAPAELCRACGELSFAPPGVPGIAQAVVGAALIAAISLAVIRHLRQQDRTESVQIGAAGAASFAVGLVVVRALGLAGPLTPRLVWPVLLFGGLAVGALLCLRREPVRRTGNLWLTFWLAAQSIAVILAPRVYPALEGRLGTRPLPAFVRSEPALLANRAWEVWRQTGRLAYYVPMRPHETRLLAVDTLPAWAARHDVHYLIWYDEGNSAADEQLLYGALPSVIKGGGTRDLRPVWRGDSVTVLEIAGGG